MCGMPRRSMRQSQCQSLPRRQSRMSSGKRRFASRRRRCFPRRASQRGTSRLAGGAPLAPARPHLHRRPDQAAGISARIRPCHARRFHRLPRHLGDLHSFQRPPAARSAAHDHRRAGTASLASCEGALCGKLCQPLAADGHSVRHLPPSRKRTAGTRHRRAVSQNLSRPTHASARAQAASIRT
jgi:hypothetical protein